MKKHCGKCDKTKGAEQFNMRNIAKGWLQVWCRLCMKKYDKKRWDGSPEVRAKSMAGNKRRRIRNKQYVYDYLKEHPCIRCGETDVVAITFDHKNPDKKIATVSELCGGSYSLETIQTEIKKCQVLCASCHMKRTAKQHGWYKNLEK